MLIDKFKIFTFVNFDVVYDNDETFELKFNFFAFVNIDIDTFYDNR